MPGKSTDEIRAELSKYYKKKHVLLYGNSRINPKNLVLDVHMENEGEADTVQYVGSEKEEVFLGNIADAIKNDRLKKKDERKRYEEARRVYKSSEKSWKPLRGIHNVGYEPWHIVRIPLSSGGMSLDIKGDEFLDFKGTLFVDMLDYSPDNDNEYLCKIADNIEVGNVSWLVVYIYNGRDDAPDSFKKQFKHICIDEDRKKQEGEEGDVTTSEPTSFPTPQNAKWSDVGITFIDDEHVNIKVKDGIKSSVHYSQMGFKHETAPQKIKLWDTLRLFAIANGIITPRFDRKGELIKPVSVDDVRRLREKLRSYFGISGDPIARYDKGKYTKKEDDGKEFIKGEGYKTIFVVKDESSLMKQKGAFKGTTESESDY